MQRLQAYKFALRPNGEQQRLMRRFAGSCRFVFNKVLALQKARYEHGEKKLGYAGLCKLLTEWRNSTETEWLADSPVHPLQQTLKDLERAYANFFAKRAEYPRFKKKGQSDRFRYPDPKQIRLDHANSRICLPKLGWLRYRNSRNVLGELRNVTVSLSGGKWYVSIQTEREVEPPVPNGGAVGIDLGIARFATLSDGTFYTPKNSFKRHETALRKAQQAMSRKSKFSNNWKKAKARIQRIHTRIGNARRDYLHKTSTAISNNHAMVCIEDLRVKNMSKSAAGTVDQPGKNVTAKSGLNKAILDQGWGEFRRQLEYKLAWTGGWLVAVPPQHTSQTCPACEHVSADNRQTQARFACVACGCEDHADLVGAINILRAGHARFACEVSGAPRPPAAGTHRNGLGEHTTSHVVGIAGHQDGEDVNKEFLALLTQDPQAAKRQIMEDPSSSYWIKQAIVDLSRRDPLDVLYEMDLLLNLFETINDRLLGFTPHPHSRIRQITPTPDSPPDTEELFDQYPGEIEIGGTLDRLLLPEFLTTLQGASVCLGWNSDLFSPDSEQQLLQALDRSHHLHFYNSLALEGEFDLLETWLVQHQLPFRRTSKGSTRYQAERVEFRRGLTTPQCMTIDGSGQDLIARDELRAVYRYLKEGRPDDATVRLEQVMGVSLQPLPTFHIANTVPCEPGPIMHLG